MELLNLSFRSWMLLGVIFAVVSLLAEILTRWITSKISCWIQNRKEVSGDD